MTFGQAVGALGIALATAISWTAYQSIWWAILQGGLGWVYVIYYAITG